MKRRRLLYPGLVLILIAIVAVFFTDLFGSPIAGLPRMRLQRTTTFTTSSVTLRDVRELYALTTVEYVHRFVFPYDFMPEGISIQDITRQLRGSQGEVADILTPDQLLYYRTYNLATDIGLSRGSEFDFVVITLVLTAGFVVSPEGPALDAMGVEEYRDDSGVSRRRAVVSLPPARIVSTAVEDITPETYLYPDLALGAEGWRRVTEYVREHPLDEPTEARILGAAEENGRVFLDGLLRNAGFDDVAFVEETGAASREGQSPQ
jgi:hypothetical protein